MKPLFARGMICLAAGLPATALAQPEKTALDVKAGGSKTFFMNDRVGNNQVTVFSESTLEDFTGVCNRVAGQCSVDPKALESFSGKFSIRVADISTGIKLRDSHMRGADWLDEKKHPEIAIEVKKVEDVKKTAADTATMTLIGTCKLHGKTQDVRIPATLKYLDESPKTMRRVKGDLVRIRAKFGIKLSDYGIGGPSGSDIVGLKVSNEMDIRVTLFGSTERPPDALEADKDAPRRTPPKRPPGG